jgi:nitroreductase
MLEGLSGLRAVRAFLPRPIAETDVDRIIEAGRWSGSSMNSQSWTFVVVREMDRRRRLSDCGKFATHLSLAPLVVVFVNSPGRGDFDLGRVAQNMMLAAKAIGVGSCPATLHFEDQARDLLLVPSDRSCRFAVGFGFPDEIIEFELRHQMKGVFGEGRKPVTKIVRYETFS